MKSDKLKKWILSLTDDIEFDYLGIHGSICPFSADNIAVCYGENIKEYNNIEDVMKDEFWNGKSLLEISTELDYYIEPYDELDK